MAHALGEAGARLMLCARQADDLEAACAELQADGIDARWVAADGAVEADMHKLVSETLQRMGDVDILVNSAADTWGALAPDPVQAWDQMMALNVRAMFVLSQLVGQHSMLARGGRIINLAPVSTQADPRWRLARDTARGSVIHFTQTLAEQWRAYGITLNTLCLGACSGTASTAQSDGDELKGITVLLASDAGQHITGQCFTVNTSANLKDKT
jgi:gluconate 5-dehydrogenase